MTVKRGFSLIETTVALALLAVIVVTVLSGFSATTLAATRHQQETTLDRMTRSDAEYIKSQPYLAAANYAHLSLGGYSFSTQVLHYNKNSNPTFAALIARGSRLGCSRSGLFRCRQDVLPTRSEIV